MAKAGLYNLSGYAKAYTPAKGEPANGFMISGYRDSEDGGKEYCNIWVPAKSVVSKRKMPDGSFALTIAFTDVKVKVKGEEEEARTTNAAKKGTTGTPAKGKPKSGKPSDGLEDFDEGDIPF